MMNVLDLLKKYHEPKRVSSTKGGEYHSPCPGCGGEDRFHVWPEENAGAGSWWCRGCSRGGDAIQFLRDFAGMGYREACDALGMDPKPIERPTRPVWTQPPRSASWTPAVCPMPSDLWQSRARKMVIWCFEHLMNLPGDAPAKVWLSRRGINEGSIKRFGIGVNPGEKEKDMFRRRESWSLPTEIKPDGKPKMLWIPKGLVIPWNVNGAVCRVRIRRESDDPRYYVLPGSSMGCFMAGPKTPRAVVVVESELDAVMLAEQVSLPGIPFSVVALGNASRKPDAPAADLLRSASVILNALDADDAGAAQDGWWKQHFPQTVRWPVPVGKDPGEAYQQGVDVSKWIRAGLPAGWFL